MSGRLKELMKDATLRCTEGSALLLEVSAFYRDTVSGVGVAQMKWRNLDRREVIAVLIDVNGYDILSNPLEPVSYQYDGMQVPCRGEFGVNVPILVTDKRAVRYTVNVRAIVYSDGVTWRAEDDGAMTELPAAPAEPLKEELLAQYQRDLAEKEIRCAARHQPQQAAGLWQCSCGSWQPVGVPCHACGNAYEALNELCAEPGLSQRADAYREEQERIAREKEEQERIARVLAQAEAEGKAREERIACEKAEQERIACEKAEEERRLAQQEAEERRMERRGTAAAVWMVVLTIVGFGAIILPYTGLIPMVMGLFK